MKKVSILDIARETGLSRNTVSRALNLDESVSQETKQKVIGTAYRMNYTKLSDRALKEIKVSMLASQRNFIVLISKETSDFWNRIVIGICDEIKKNKAICQVCFISKEEEEGLSLPDGLDPDVTTGLIFLSVFRYEFMEEIAKLNIPSVFLDAPREYKRRGDIFILEGYRSTYKLTRSLIENGYRKIGFIGDITYCQSLYERWMGYKEAMKTSGLAVHMESCLCGPTEHRYYKDYELFSALKQVDFPEAFVCANDKIAFDLYMYAQMKGISIPGQLAITGFDNDKESRILTPSLSTVKIDNYLLGRRLAQQLLWRLKNTHMPLETVCISTQVIFRESSVKR